MNEVMEVCDFMLFQFYYILLFSMRLITITLSVESIEELDDKLRKFYRNAKVLFAIYNFIYIVKLVIQGVIDLHTIPDEKEKKLIIALTCFAYV